MTHLHLLLEKAGRATPGPWATHNAIKDGGALGSMDDVAIRAGNDALIAETWLECPLPGGGKYVAPSRDNATFIAACSPELITALVKVALAAEDMPFPSRPVKEALAALRDVKP